MIRYMIVHKDLMDRTFIRFIENIASDDGEIIRNMVVDGNWDHSNFPENLFPHLYAEPIFDNYYTRDQELTDELLEELGDRVVKKTGDIFLYEKKNYKKVGVFNNQYVIITFQEHNNKVTRWEDLSRSNEISLMIYRKMER